MLYLRAIGSKETSSERQRFISFERIIILPCLFPFIFLYTSLYMYVYDIILLYKEMSGDEKLTLSCCGQLAFLHLLRDSRKEGRGSKMMMII